MFGDRPCPGCGQALGRRYERRPGRLVAVYTCQACAKDWPSCPRCVGLVVEKLRPGDLFSRLALKTYLVCTSCRSELPKKDA